MDDKNLFINNMSKVEKIKTLIYRDCVRKFKFLEEKRKIFMADVKCTVCGVIYLINDFAGNNMVLEDIGRTCDSLNVAREGKWIVWCLA